MNEETVTYLRNLHFITQGQYDKIKQVYADNVFSVYYEIRAVIIVGVILILSGLIKFANDNIYTIGQDLIILMLFVIMGASFAYAVAKGTKYSFTSVASPGLLFDISIVFGCIMMYFTLAYAEYAYAPFSNKWEFVGLTSGLVSFLFAYRYDQRGTLSFGIVCLATSILFAVSPLPSILRGSISASELIAVGMAYGALLLVIAFTMHQLNIKRHFTITYVHFGAHSFFVSSLAGLLTEDLRLISLLLLTVLSASGAYYAKRFNAFSIFLVTMIYGYLSLSYLVSQVVTDPVAQSMYGLVSFAGAIVAVMSFRKHLSAEP